MSDTDTVQFENAAEIVRCAFLAVEVLDDSFLADQVAAAFNVSELAPIVELLRACDRDEAAELWIQLNGNAYEEDAMQWIEMGESPDLFVDADWREEETNDDNG